jgi:NAD(P)-dependent dehydrogenase (short-subunit alcohol dehydrogenase family)
VPSDQLEGVALVTGGGRGIGASIARELAEAGMRVAVTARTRDQVEAVAAEVGGLALVGDVSQVDDVHAWVESTEERLGPIALLVSCAGIGGTRKPFLDISPEEWWRVFEVNTLGPYLCTRAGCPRHGEARRRPNRQRRERRLLPPRYECDDLH